MNKPRIKLILLSKTLRILYCHVYDRTIETIIEYNYIGQHGTKFREKKNVI